MRYNKFGTLFPSDNDPRWIPYDFTAMSDQFLFNALPMGTIIRPDRRAYLQDYNLWEKLKEERDKMLLQQSLEKREHTRVAELQRVKEEKKLKLEREQLIKEKKKLEDSLNKIKKDYEREIRSITREVDAKYKPVVSKINKQIKEIEKKL